MPFILFFTGLAQASAPSAAFIHKTLFVWVALLAVPFLGERLGWLQLAALGVLLAGQALVAHAGRRDLGHGRDDDRRRDAPLGGRDDRCQARVLPTSRRRWSAPRGWASASSCSSASSP